MAIITIPTIDHLLLEEGDTDPSIQDLLERGVIAFPLVAFVSEDRREQGYVEAMIIDPVTAQGVLIATVRYNEDSTPIIQEEL